MTEPGEAVLIKDAVVFLFAAGIVVPLLRLARLPTMMGFVLAGVALGPGGFGALGHDHPAFAAVTISEPEAARPFAELGVLFLLFLIGLELSAPRLWALRRVVFGAGPLQVAACALIFALAGVTLGLEPTAAALVGLALALSSTAVVMQLLTGARQAAGPVGQASLGVLLFQDLLVAPILIFVGFASQDSGAGLARILIEALVEGAVAVVVIFVIGRFLLRRVFTLAAGAGGREFLMAVTLLVVVGAAIITASAGLSLALGAFLAGLLLGETEFKHQTEVDLEPFKGLLLGLFFMTVGMNLDLGSVAPVAGWVVAAAAGALVIKATVAFTACRLFAGGAALSLESGFLLASAGEFAFVILAAGQDGGVIDRTTVNFVAAVVGLSMFATPVMWRLGRWAAAATARETAHEDIDSATARGHVLIAGFGRVGAAVGGVLHAEEAEFIALDKDPKRVARERDKGWRVFVGDAAREDMLIKTGARGAAMVVVTIDEAANAERIVRAVRALCPNTPILARARDAEHAAALTAAGANFVVPDAIEAGLQMAARALGEFGYAGEWVRDRIAAERDAAYRSANED